MTGVLLLGFLFLSGAVLAVPIATRLGLGSVLGYLVAGILLAPLLSAIGVDVVEIQHFAEFGVVMMLFLVGLELEPERLWGMRARLLGLGGLQVTLSAALVALGAHLLGQPWPTALAIGLVLSLSSTAIVLQTLGEKGLLRSAGGQGSFSVLLFQDLAVIPMLAFMPLLAVGGDGAAHGAVAPVDAAGEGAVQAMEEAARHGAPLSLVAGLDAWAAAALTIGAVVAIGLGGTYLTRPVFRYIAMARLRELFTATALLFVVGIALLMSLVELSPALGTFLAGVVLANSEYRHELQSDIDPFRGLLLGLFFITVGAGIDFGLLGAEAVPLLGATLALLLVKGAVLYALARAFGIGSPDRWLVALGLAQAGEFGFVLLSFTTGQGILPQAVADRLLLVVTLSMLLTPALFVLYERVVVPRSARSQRPESDEMEPGGQVLIAGHGRFGGIVHRMLRGAGHTVTVLDYDAAKLEAIRAFGLRVFFGDATRPDLLHAAGVERARLLVICIDGREAITELVRYMVRHHPHVHVIARALDRQHVYELWAAGCRDIVRETFDSGVRTGRSALEALGMRRHDAERLARRFTMEDKRALRELAEVYDPGVPVHRNAAYVTLANQLAEERESNMQAEIGGAGADTDRAWPPVPDARGETDGEAGADKAEGR